MFESPCGKKKVLIKNWLIDTLLIHYIGRLLTLPGPLCSHIGFGHVGIWATYPCPQVAPKGVALTLPASPPPSQQRRRVSVLQIFARGLREGSASQRKGKGSVCLLLREKIPPKEGGDDNGERRSQKDILLESMREGPLEGIMCSLHRLDRICVCVCVCGMKYESIPRGLRGALREVRRGYYRRSK